MNYALSVFKHSDFEYLERRCTALLGQILVADVAFILSVCKPGTCTNDFPIFLANFITYLVWTIKTNYEYSTDDICLPNLSHSQNVKYKGNSMKNTTL